jgi:hypothetical protein
LASVGKQVAIVVNRRLEITQRQVRALCEGAKKAGHIPILRIGNVVVEFVPEERHGSPQKEAAQYERATRTLSDEEHVAAKEVMNSWVKLMELPEKERRAILKQEYDEWAIEFRKTPLGKKERRMLKFLCENTGQRFPVFRTVRGCGDHTVIRLQARGYVAASIKGSPEPFELHYFGDQPEMMWATSAGCEAWRKATEEQL